MQMTNEEIIRRYKAAGDDKRRMIRILSELNACPKENIRQILREAGCEVPATGNRYTKKKGAEVAEEPGSERKQAKLTEKGKQLLKNEEPTDSSDLSAPEDVGTCQQNVGTMSEDPGKRMFGDSLEAKKEAPTCCQPAEPVDAWDEKPGKNVIERAKRDLAEVEDNIMITKTIIQAQKFNLEKDENRRAFLQEWIQKHEGRTEG